MTSGTIPSVIVAEDQPLLRLGIVQALKAAGYTVLAETEDGPTLIEKTLELRPGAVLIKKDLPKIDGVQCVKRIRKACGSDTATILLLSDPADFWDALNSGASGYAMRETIAELLPHAIKQVCHGLCWIGPNIAKYLVAGRGLPVLLSAARNYSQAPYAGRLSDREMDVLHLLIEGSSNQEIAHSLNLKLQTVKVHIKSILRKLEVKSRAEAISQVLRSGLR